jgi:hypothetical protein
MFSFLKGISVDQQMKDYAHASYIFRTGNYRLAPKYQFLFYVRFNLNKEHSMYQGLNGTTGDTSEVGALVKTISLPKFTAELKTLNAYNRVNIVQTKLKYDPVTIRFHDDGADTIRKLWYDYYSFYYRDSDYADGLYGAPHKYLGRATDLWGYTLRDNDGKFDTRLINNIQIYSFHQKKFSEVTLHNPLISSFRHGEHDMAQGTGVMEQEMTVQFETVTYSSGYFTSENFGSDMLLNYDNKPSTMTPLDITPRRTGITSYPIVATTAVSGAAGTNELEVASSQGDLGVIEAGQEVSGEGIADGTVVDESYDGSTTVPLSEPLTADARGVYAFGVQAPGERGRGTGTAPNTELTYENGAPVQVSQAIDRFTQGGTVEQNSQSGAYSYGGNYSYGPGAQGFTAGTTNSGAPVKTNNSVFSKVATGVGSALVGQIIRGRNPLSKIDAPAISNLLYQAGTIAGKDGGKELIAAGGLLRSGQQLAKGGIGPGNLGTAISAIKNAGIIADGIGKLGGLGALGGSGGKKPEELLPFNKNSSQAVTNGTAVGRQLASYPQTPIPAFPPLFNNIIAYAKTQEEKKKAEQAKADAAETSSLASRYPPKKYSDSEATMNDSADAGPSTNQSNPNGYA